MAHEQAKLQLPDTALTVIDIGRLQRELEAVDNFLAQASAREGGTSVTLPKTTRAFEDFAKQNGLQLLQKADREQLAAFLDKVRNDAPVIHMSFSAEPSAAFLQKVVGWLRKEVHPMTLVQVGLQPSIAAGCVVRTTNKYFDFSMRKHFNQNRDLLVESLRKGAASGG